MRFYSVSYIHRPAGTDRIPFGCMRLCIFVWFLLCCWRATKRVQAMFGQIDVGCSAKTRQRRRPRRNTVPRSHRVLSALRYTAANVPLHDIAGCSTRRGRDSVSAKHTCVWLFSIVLQGRSHERCTYHARYLQNARYVWDDSTRGICALYALTFQFDDACSCPVPLYCLMTYASLTIAIRGSGWAACL